MSSADVSDSRDPFFASQSRRLLKKDWIECATSCLSGVIWSLVVPVKHSALIWCLVVSVIHSALKWCLLLPVVYSGVIWCLLVCVVQCI